MMAFVNSVKKKQKDKKEDDKQKNLKPAEPWDVKTEYDKVLESISSGKNKLGDIAKNTGIGKKEAKSILLMFENRGKIKINYPALGDINAKIIKQEKKSRHVELPEKRELKGRHEVTADHVKGSVNLWLSPNEDIPIYEIVLPRIGEGTNYFIDHMIDQIAKDKSIIEPDFSDPSKNRKTREQFFQQARERVNKKLSSQSKDVIDTITGTILHRMYGLGDMEIMMNDDWLEEIAINGARVPVSVYHKRFGWAKTTFLIETDEEVYNYASQIGRKVGRQINNLNPLMDAHLVSGDRVAATLSPISTSGNTITIRRFSRNPWTITHLVDPELGTMSTEIAAFLWLCMQYELNVLVAGGTASGKTSVLNSICSLIPTTQRILSIEDTREIALPKDLEWNWVPLSSRKANPEGKGEIRMLDLMVESLRMRPDRIVVGEVRRREQAETLFETMHTGHSVYTTIHADTVEQVGRRLMEPPIEIPKSEIGALQLILVQYRDRRTGKRRVLELAEILSQETEGKNLALNYLYRWRPRNDSFEKINDSIRVMEDLNLHTGMTSRDISENLKNKQNILEWLVKHKVLDVDKVGSIVKLYYRDPDKVIEAANNDQEPGKLIGE